MPLPKAVDVSRVLRAPARDADGWRDLLGDGRLKVKECSDGTTEQLDGDETREGADEGQEVTVCVQGPSGKQEVNFDVGDMTVCTALDLVVRIQAVGRTVRLKCSDDGMREGGFAIEDESEITLVRIGRNPHDLGLADLEAWIEEKRVYAKQAFAAQDFEKAAVAFRRSAQLASAIRKHDADKSKQLRKQATLNQAVALSKTGANHASVIMLCTTVLTMDPECVKAMVLKGVAYRRDGKADKAAEMLRTASRSTDDAETLAEIKRELSLLASETNRVSKEAKQAEVEMSKKMFSSDKGLGGSELTKQVEAEMAKKSGDKGLGGSELTKRKGGVAARLAEMERDVAEELKQIEPPTGHFEFVKQLLKTLGNSIALGVLLLIATQMRSFFTDYYVREE